MSRISNDKYQLQHSVLAKILTLRLLDFSRDEGVLDLARSLGDFTLEAFIVRLEKDRSYHLADSQRRRMISLLLRFLVECGILANGPDGRFLMPGERAPESLETALEGWEKDVERDYLLEQVEFFTLCIDRGADFLMGEGSVYSFSEEHAPVWKNFLKSSLFKDLRVILLRLMEVEDSPDYKMLDLCYGPGHSIDHILERYPTLSLTAMDFCSIYKDEVGERTNENKSSNPLRIVNEWKGFGHPLPFASESFDGVHFAFADPYIPDNLREDFYREVYRVLKPGGVMGLLAWCYPGEEERAELEPWVMRQIIAHDFAESVCEGWQGFHTSAETEAVFSRIGFKRIEPSLLPDAILHSALWVMEKEG